MTPGQFSLMANQEITIVLDAFSLNAAGNHILDINELVCPMPTDLGNPQLPHQEMGNCSAAAAATATTTR